ncbi:hypothetical protein [Hyphococcus sp.]|uniref:hypothetical protein n=1 Tax=Hyphococcus sp. TaxID=2038636 RepID=UPI003CCBC670
MTVRHSFRLSASRKRGRAVRMLARAGYACVAAACVWPISAAAQTANANWAPTPYPAHCVEAAKHYDALPKINIDSDYESPNEVVVNYTEFVDPETGEYAPGLANAVSALGGMVGYADKLKAAYEQAARDYWNHFDRTGRSDPALEKEYGYWKWRRGQFSREVAGIQGVGMASGSGAAQFLSNTLGGRFGVPSGVQNIDDSRDYDYVRYSQCTLEHGQTVEEAIEYEVLLDAIPGNVEAVSSWVEAMEIDRLSPQDKALLVNVMRERRKTDTGYDGTPHSGLSGSAEAVRAALDQAREGVSATLSAFLEFVNYGANSLETGKHSWRLAAPKYPGGSSFGAITREQYDWMAANSLYLYGIHPTKNGAQVGAEFFPGGYEQAGKCATGKLPEAARYMHDRLGPVMDKAAQEQTYNKEFCLEPAYRLRGSRNPLVPRQAENYACMGQDAWRLAMIACATGNPVGADEAIARALLSKYPAQ